MAWPHMTRGFDLMVVKKVSMWTALKVGYIRNVFSEILDSMI
jgi:hypothetical protein